MDLSRTQKADGTVTPISAATWPDSLAKADLLALTESTQTTQAARYWQAYEGTLYEGRRYNWAGDIEQATYGQYGTLRGVDYQRNDPPVPPPMSDRRPNARKSVARTIVRGYTRLVFSSARMPQIMVTGDPDAQDYVREIARAAQMGPRMREARAIGGATGAVACSYAYVRGRPVIRVHNPLYLYVLAWADRDALEPAVCVECYPTRQSVIAIGGKQTTVQMYYVSVWTQDRHLCWGELTDRQLRDTDSSGRRTWMDLQHREVAHGMGRCPMVWCQNIPRSDRAMGDSDYQSLLDDIQDLDYLTSYTSDGARRNTDPTLVVRQPPGESSRRVRLGSDSVLFAPQGAEWLELRGDSVRTAREWGAERLADISHATGAIFADLETLAAKAQSAAAMRLLYAPMLAEADNLREQYGECLVIPLLRGLLDAARRYQRNSGGRVVVAPNGQRMQELPTVSLDPRIEVGDDGRGTPVERTPGVLSCITLAWPAYFPDSPADRKVSTEAVIAAAGRRPVISQESAVRWAATLYDVDDVPAELERLEEEQAQATAHAMLGGPQAPPDATQQPGMERSELWGDDGGDSRERGTTDGATGESESDG